MIVERFAAKPLRYQLLFAACLLYLAAMFGFCIFYYTHTYNALCQWYLGMNGCFYRHEEWTTIFFTPSVKSAGDTIAIMGGIIAVALMGYLWYRKNSYFAPAIQTGIKTEKTTWGSYLLIIYLGVKACKWASGLMSPTNDEVFSAVNCSDLPAFQCLSYYMLPNNHILFNVLDHFVGVHADKVATGRMISEGAYIASLLCIFLWLKEHTNSKIAALLILLPVSLQFTTLGFGVLSRGYSLQLFCGVAALMNFARYTRTGVHKYLRYNTVFNIIGFLLVPSYLFFYLAQVCCSLFATQTRRLPYWRHQLLTGAAVILFYIPASCFSGAASLIHNRYNLPTTPDVASFLPMLGKGCAAFSTYCFSLNDQPHALGYALFFLPLFLFLVPGREHKAIALFYLLMWVVCIGCTAQMRHLPNQRSVSIQFCITMICAVYTLYTVARQVLSYVNGYIIRSIAFLLVFTVPVLLGARYLYNYCEGNFFYLLYGYDITANYRNTMQQVTAVLPAGSSIACSNESFYINYICQTKGSAMTQCATGNEDYYITSYDDKAALPVWISKYELISNDPATEHIIYKKKP